MRCREGARGSEASPATRHRTACSHEERYQDRLAFHKDAVQCHHAAVKAASAFNTAFHRAVTPAAHPLMAAQGPVAFLDCLIYRLEDPRAPGGRRYLAAEEFLAGRYTKYNNNAGFVAPESRAAAGAPGAAADGARALGPDAVAQAFTHFSYQHSGGEVMVCDIQGTGQKFTDPQLHSLGRAYGPADLGVEGFRRFFATHNCGALCRKLGLVKPEL